MKSLVRGAAATAVVLASALSLSGCGVGSADTALVIDGQPVSERGVQQAAEQLTTTKLLGRPVTTTDVTTMLVQSRAILRYFGAKKVTATPEGAAALLAARGVREPSQESLEITRALLVFDQAQKRGAYSQKDDVELSKTVQQQSVTVNPRYGQWNAQSGAITPSAPDWMVRSTPAAP